MSGRVKPRGLLTAIAVVIAGLAFIIPVALAAGPAVYCGGVFLPSATTCVHGNNWPLARVRGVSERQDGSRGSAATCVGSQRTRGGSTVDGPFCGAPGQYADSGFLGVVTEQAYPALHNHSTFQSRFTGQFYYYD
jgi:hypothetical protein